MSLSYPIVNRGKVTLPSVEGFAGNLNIQKNPPASIMTRRRDRVGDNNDITQMMDDSDRSTEAILRFSRGVNPSVSVSYSNNGGSTMNFGNQQAKLPYTINKDGDFRQKQFAPYDLIALSRIPRDTTSAITNPGISHQNKELDNTRNQTAGRNVKQTIASSHVRSKHNYMIQKPLNVEGFTINNNIQDVLQKNTTTTSTSTDRTMLNVLEPTNGINDNLLYAFAEANKRGTNYVNNNIVDPNRYLQDTNPHSVFSNIGTQFDNGSQNTIDLSTLKTQELNVIEYSTPLKGPGGKQGEVITENFTLRRVIPMHISQTNKKTSGKSDFINPDIKLDRVLPIHDAKSNLQGDNRQINYIHQDIQLDKNLPEYSTISAKTFGNKTQTNYNFDNELEFDKNLPLYNAQTSRTSKLQNTTTYMYNNDLDLQRSLPSYQAQTSKTLNQNNNVYNHDNDISLNRTTPLHQGQTNITSNTQNVNVYNHENNIELFKNLPSYDAKTNIVSKLHNQTPYIHENDLLMVKNLPEYNIESNKTSSNQQHHTYLATEDDIEYNKNLPSYSMESTKTYNVQNNNTYLNPEMELDRNLPIYDSKTNIRGNEQVTYLSTHLDLNRTLPEYSTQTNIGQNTGETLKHEYIKEYERKAVLSKMEVNNSRRGEDNITSREYQLDERLQPGSFEPKAQIPNFNRGNQINAEFESDKSRMSKNVMKQFSDRYNK